MTHSAKFLVILLLCASASAQNLLPDAPVPQPTPQKFWDRQEIIGFASSTGMRVWDAAYTCSLMSHYPTWHEQWLPAQSCGGVTGLLMAGQAAQTGLEYFLYRTGHRRLQRIVPWVSVAVSVAAMTRSYVKLQR